MTAARPMKLPTSMCSGAIAPLAAAQLLDAVDAEDVRLDAVDLARRARRGSGRGPARAARRRRSRSSVSPGASDGGHDRVLGRHHARLVEEDLARRAGRPSASRSGSRSRSARRAARARGCAGRAGAGRSRRRPAAARSPGRGARAAGRRAGTTRGSAPRAPRRPRATRAPAASTRTSFGPVHSALAPSAASSSSIVSTSRMRGTFESVTGSSVSRHAARIGRAPFLFPAARMRPVSGFPPSMTKDLRRRLRRTSAGARIAGPWSRLANTPGRP